LSIDVEHGRLEEARTKEVPWRKWGPYLSDRQWGTVREDYSENGDAWSYFTHEQARSRAYKWGEDGIAGLCDDRQRLCFAIALWNGADPILKERMFGLTNAEGNHGEDVKEYYFFVDATPTSSYLKYRYRYPLVEFPYGDLWRPIALEAASTWSTGYSIRVSSTDDTSTSTSSTPSFSSRRPSASRSPTAAATGDGAPCCRRCGSATWWMDQPKGALRWTAEPVPLSRWSILTWSGARVAM
jgi:hypothetical protein